MTLIHFMTPMTLLTLMNPLTLIHPIPIVPYYYTYVYDGNMWILRKDLSHCYSFKLDPSMHPKDITIVTESSEESPTSSAGYTVYDHGDGIYLYDFGKARCSEVMYRGQTVSKRQSGGPYPRRIVFDAETLTFEFDFKNKTAVYKLNSAGWYISEVSDKLEHFKYEFPDWILKQTYRMILNIKYLLL